MQTVTKVFQTYEFNELPESAKQKVLQNLWDINTMDDNWHESTIEDFHEILEIMGFYDIKTYYTGFFSQGDGASFEARFSYKKGMLKAVKEYAPKDKELHLIAYRLFNLQKRCFYRFECIISQRGRYYHENTMNIEYHEPYHVEPADFLDIFRQLAKWFYRRLEKQYDYLNSQEEVIKTIIRDDYHFTIDGQMFEG